MATNLSYPTPAPVFDCADSNPDIIGHARTSKGAMRHYARHFDGTGATVIGCRKACPELRGKGPVDGWEPVFAAD